MGSMGCCPTQRSPRSDQWDFFPLRPWRSSREANPVSFRVLHEVTEGAKAAEVGPTVSDPFHAKARNREGMVRDNPPYPPSVRMLFYRARYP